MNKIDITRSLFLLFFREQSPQGLWSTPLKMISSSSIYFFIKNLPEIRTQRTSVFFTSPLLLLLLLSFFPLLLSFTTQKWIPLHQDFPSLVFLVRGSPGASVRHEISYHNLCYSGFYVRVFFLYTVVIFYHMFISYHHYLLPFHLFHHLLFHHLYSSFLLAYPSLSLLTAHFSLQRKPL